MYTNCHPHSCLGQQRGAALVLALIVVLMVVALATRVSKDYWLLYRTLDNQSSLEQAHAYLRGAEDLAAQALMLDIVGGSMVDSHLEPWAQQRTLPLPEGLLNACLIDLQSRLNLNDLGTPQGEGYSAAQKRFIRLLQVLPLEQTLDEVAAVALANAVFDWIDLDSSSRYPGGAEELEYSQQGRSYRPANQAFISVTELRQIMGMTPELVSALTPLVSVWGNGSMNINTLDSTLLWSSRTGMQSGANVEGDERDERDVRDEEPDKPMLLRTLNNPNSLRPLPESAAELVAAARSGNGGVVENLALFSSGTLARQNWELQGVGVASDYFQMNASMDLAGHRYQLKSVLQRGVDTVGRPLVVVVARTYVNGDLAAEDDCAIANP